MQKILGHMRKAIYEFDLIQDGDRIAVGVSGGKDSLVLLVGLAMLKRFIGIDYTVVAVTLDPQFEGQQTDFSSVQELCDKYDIEYVIKRTQIGEIVFGVRKEEHPCSLCARMRRGALHDLAKEYNCNKIALGHHYNDAVETFMMNLYIEGRIGCFSPKSYLSRKDLTLIRPLVLTPESEVRKVCNKKPEEFKIVKSVCPVDGITTREKTKVYLRDKEKEDNGFTYRMFGALRRSGIDGWGYRDKAEINLNNYKDYTVVSLKEQENVKALAEKLLAEQNENQLERFKNDLASGNVEDIFVATHEEKAVAMIVFLKKGDVKKDFSKENEKFLWIDYLFVTKEFRGKKLSQFLIFSSEKSLKKSGFEGLLATTSLINFYEKYDFTENGIAITNKNEPVKIYSKKYAKR